MMHSVGSTRSWIRNMMEAGYSDEYIRNEIISQAADSIKEIIRQEKQDISILNTMIKEGITK